LTSAAGIIPRERGVPGAHCASTSLFHFDGDVRVHAVLDELVARPSLQGFCYREAQRQSRKHSGESHARFMPIPHPVSRWLICAAAVVLSVETGLFRGASLAGSNPFDFLAPWVVLADALTGLLKQIQPMTLVGSSHKAACLAEAVVPSGAEPDRSASASPTGSRLYALVTYSCSIRCAVKNDPFNAIAWRMTSMNPSRR
jgi:hypothetical protein